MKEMDNNKETLIIITCTLFVINGLSIKPETHKSQSKYNVSET